MTDDLNLRLEKVEGTLETVEGTLGVVVVHLEGAPVLDIDGTKIGTEGGMVKQLDNILEQLPRCWTTTQRISASMVVVVFFVGSLPLWAF